MGGGVGGGRGQKFQQKNLQISKNCPTIWKKIFNESKTEDLSPSRSLNKLRNLNSFYSILPKYCKKNLFPPFKGIAKIFIMLLALLTSKHNNKVYK